MEANDGETNSKLSNHSTFSLIQESIKIFNKTKIPNSDYMDLRMIQFLEMHSWKLVQKYKNETVVIPGHPGSDVELVKYFQVVKKPGEPFYSENQEDNEIGLTLWFGWPGYDHEVEVNLFIRGKDVTGSRNVVSAEILKCGGAPMSVSYRGKVLTDFKKNTWVGRQNVDKVWIPDLHKFLNNK